MWTFGHFLRIGCWKWRNWIKDIEPLGGTWLTFALENSHINLPSYRYWMKWLISLCLSHQCDFKLPQIASRNIWNIPNSTTESLILLFSEDKNFIWRNKMPAFMHSPVHWDKGATKSADTLLSTMNETWPHYLGLLRDRTGEISRQRKNHQQGKD